MSRSWQGRRVAVTGGTGMTGSFLVERLLALGARVRVAVRPGRARQPWLAGAEVVEGDLADPVCCAELLDGAGELLHLASCRRNVAWHHEKSGEVSRANVAMTMALLAALQERPATSVVFFSTANITQPLDPLELQHRPTIDGYVAGKYAAELLWLAAARERGQRLLVLRPVGIYGPRDWFSADGNVIPSLIVKASGAEGPLAIWGSGRQERSFLYVEDVVGALLRLLDHDAEGLHYVSPPEVVTIGDLAAQIRDLVRPGLPLAFDTSRQEGVLRLSRQPLPACLQDYPWTPLAEGIRRTAAWWAANR